jgi:hypothetical protein
MTPTATQAPDTAEHTIATPDAPRIHGAQRGADLGCSICQSVIDIHWTGPIAGGKGSHCLDCCRTWTSKSEGHCAGCCAHFATSKAFDMHFGPGDTHLDPAVAVRRDGKPRFVARQRPGGVTWALAFYGTIPTNFGRRGPSADVEVDDDEPDDSSN